MTNKMEDARITLLYAQRPYVKQLHIRESYLDILIYLTTEGPSSPVVDTDTKAFWRAHDE